MSKTLRMTGLGLACAWSLFQLGVGVTIGLPDLVFFPVHVAFALAVAFALTPARGGGEFEEDGLRQRGALDVTTAWVAIAAALGIGLYYVLNDYRIAMRIPLVDRLDGWQYLVSIALLALTIEATRRTAGLGMVIVVLVFVAYALFGHLLPGVFATTSMELNDFLDQQAFTTEGVFGIPISISATYVFYFVLFAAFLEISGGGKLFIDLAIQVTRRTYGGSAKAAVVSSGLLGMTSGSAVANVVSTGVFTIPLMKKSGYSPRFAGAVEALSSTGAQIMPPLMGAAAFIMANTLGVGYDKIIVAAAIPAFLYYVAVYFAVDFQTRRINLVPGETTLEKREGYLQRLHLLIPLLYLVYAVVSGRPLMLSALEAIGLVVVVSWLSPATRLWPRKVIHILATGGARVVSVAIPCAAAGIVVAVVVQTGVGLRFTEFLVGATSSNELMVLLVVMLGCLVMGMGLPTTAAYIMAATLFVPALTRVGIAPLPAHMFVFYFACLSMITPPVALASYAAASIAGASASGTGWLAARVGVPLFIVPFAFVNNTALLAQADPFTVAAYVLVALVGIAAFSGVMIGYFRARNLAHETLMLAAGAVFLIYYPDNVPVQLLGGALILGVGALQQVRRRSAVPLKS